MSAPAGLDHTASIASAAPIICVMFVHESGYVESYRRDEIRQSLDGFRAILAEHRAAGRRPLVMRSAAK